MSEMTPERLAEIRARLENKYVCMHSTDKSIERELLAHIDAQAKQIEQLEKDKETLDKLIGLINDENGNAVVIVWNNYQDFAQVRLLDGTVLSEVNDSDKINDDMDGDESSGVLLREAIDNAKIKP